MNKCHIIIDTNVILTGLKSQYGASYKLLQLVGQELFDIHTSVSLILEYEDVLLRENNKLNLTEEAIRDIINYHCSVSIKHKIFYLWRPYLPDPKDDYILELAVAGNVDYIVTYNKKDFPNIENFGIKTITPKEFLQLIGEIK
jgi:putative PIN family toxin of toxin-antitoxin system